jgi:hypothetical protein
MAGSKPGERRGGRRKGTPNKATAAKEAAIAASGLTPLDFMLNALRDEENDFATRFEAAKSAAPYCHPKRAPVDGDGQETGVTLNVFTGVPRGD